MDSNVRYETWGDQCHFVFKRSFPDSVGKGVHIIKAPIFVTEAVPNLSYLILQIQNGDNSEETHQKRALSLSVISHCRKLLLI